MSTVQDPNQKPEEEKKEGPLTEAEVDELFETEQEVAPEADRPAPEENPDEVTLNKKRTWGEPEEKKVETETEEQKEGPLSDEELDNLFNTDVEVAPEADRPAPEENPDEVTLNKKRTWGEPEEEAEPVSED